MRALLLAFALLAPGLAFAPAASAKPYCTYGEPGCDGLVCTYDPEACVGDPCWFACAAAAPEVECVPLYSGPFSSGEVCVDASQAPKCGVYVETYYMGETTRTCYGVGVSAAGSAAPSCSPLVHGYGWDSYLCHDVKGAPFCAVWTETRWWESGTVSKTCIPNLPTDVPPGAGDVLETGAAGPECYEIHSERTVGPVTIVQRSSCEYEVYWNGEPLLQ